MGDVEGLRTLPVLKAQKMHFLLVLPFLRSWVMSVRVWWGR